MSSITDGLNHLIDQMVETDRRMARRAGEHIDKTNQILQEARTSAPASKGHIKELPSAIPIPFAPVRKRMTKKWLEELVKPYTQANPKKFQGITKAKGLSIDGFAAWLIERDIDVIACWEECLTFPTPLELLTYWRFQGPPSLAGT